MDAGYLHAVIAAVCPILGVSVGTWGQANTVAIQYSPTATTEQQAAAQSALASFDWSQTAYQTWANTQTSTAAGTALATAADTTSVAMRATSVQIYTRVNDVAEGMRAALELICQAANITMPSAAAIQAQIAADRTASPVDSGATDPGTVSTTFGVRVTEATIMANIQAVLEAGGGLPGGG